MDEPPRKRRKTASPVGDERPPSPLKQPPRRPSFSLRPYITAEDGRASPLKEPPRRFPVSPTKGASDRPSSPLKEPPRRSSRRPSFASPTKASLARGYPDLLKRPTSSGALVVNGREELLARGKEARAFILGEKSGQMQPETTRENGRQTGDEATAGATLSRSARKDPNITPRAQRTLPRTLGPTDHLDVEEELDLPASHSQGAAEEQYTPRPGLFSSPSRRPPRLKNGSKPSTSPRKALGILQNRSDNLLNILEYAAEGDAQEKPKKRQPPDPIIEEKKREKARLSEELKALERQVSRATEAIAKGQAQPSDYVATSQDREGLINLINDLCKSEADQEAEEQHQPISVLLSSFLPFSTGRIAPPKPSAESQAPIASHHPLELDDPLPYLQMFTSFKFNTKLAVPRGQNPHSNRVHQRHVIDITGPQNLLTAQVSITLDTLTNTILDLKLLQLSPWADRELGSFIRTKVLSQDLGNACWAVDSYWNIAKKRAEYWHRCETAFAHLLPGQTTHDTENLTVRHDSSAKTLSRKDLSRQLGRDVLVLEDRYVVLSISWTVSFDWTGEAQSEIGVVPAVPRVWKEADTSDAFKKIPETFTSLLQSKGAFAATKTMVALLFEE